MIEWLRKWFGGCSHAGQLPGYDEPPLPVDLTGSIEIRLVMSPPPGPPSPSPAPPPATGGKDEQLAGSFAGVDVTCSQAGVYYEAFELALDASVLEPNMRLGVRASFGWTALPDGYERRMTIAYGKSFDAAMNGSTSSKTGRALLNRTSDDAANQSDFEAFIDVLPNMDMQRLKQSSTGDQHTGTGSTPPTGAVQLSAGDCLLFIGVKSEHAGDVIHVDGIEIWKTRAC